MGVLGGVDLAEPFVQPGDLLFAAGGVLSRGQAFGEHGGAVGAEDPGGEELADDGEQVVLADPDGAGVLGGGSGVPGVERVVRAAVIDVPGVPGVGAYEAAGHAAFAVAAPAPRPEQVGAVDGGVGGQAGLIAGAGMLGADALGGVPGFTADDRRIRGLGGPDPLVLGDVVEAAGAGGAAAAVDHVPGVFGGSARSHTPRRPSTRRAWARGRRPGRRSAGW
jgi:hypothetical protein